MHGTEDKPLRHNKGGKWPPKEDVKLPGDTWGREERRLERMGRRRWLAMSGSAVRMTATSSRMPFPAASHAGVIAASVAAATSCRQFKNDLQLHIDNSMLMQPKHTGTSSGYFSWN